MKAKVIKTGEIIEASISHFSFDHDVETEYTDEYGNYYKEFELEKIPEQLPENTTIEGWVARDKDGLISLYEEEPWRSEERWRTDGGVIPLVNYSFPSITWKSGPEKVKIEITL